MQRTWLCWSNTSTILSSVHRGDPILFKQAFISFPITLTTAGSAQLKGHSTAEMGTKRAKAGDDKPAKVSKISLVNSARIRSLGEGKRGEGPVVYW